MSLGGSIEGGGDINSLGGVSITSPTNGQFLVYDSVSGNWINSNGGGSTGYQTIQGQGVSMPQQTTLNFASDTFTVVDNPGSSRTDVFVSGVITWDVVAVMRWYVSSNWLYKQQCFTYYFNFTRNG